MIGNHCPRIKQQATPELQQRYLAMFNHIAKDLEQTFNHRDDISIHHFVNFTEQNLHYNLDFVIFHPDGVILIDCAPNFADYFRGLGTKQFGFKPTGNPNNKYDLEATPLMKLNKKCELLKHANQPVQTTSPILRLLTQRADETWHKIIVTEQINRPMIAKIEADKTLLICKPVGVAPTIKQFVLGDSDYDSKSPWMQRVEDQAQESLAQRIAKIATTTNRQQAPLPLLDEQPSDSPLQQVEIDKDQPRESLAQQIAKIATNTKRKQSQQPAHNPQGKTNADQPQIEAKSADNIADQADSAAPKFVNPLAGTPLASFYEALMNTKSPTEVEIAAREMNDKVQPPTLRYTYKWWVKH